MITKIGKWYKPANNYELLNEFEPFSIQELEEVEQAFKKIVQQLKENEIRSDERGLAVITDFIKKARQRIMMSEQDIQADYEHRNTVTPSDAVQAPKGGSGASGGSDKSQTQQSGNNNGGANVGS